MNQYTVVVLFGEGEPLHGEDPYIAAFQVAAVSYYEALHKAAELASDWTTATEAVVVGPEGHQFYGEYTVQHVSNEVSPLA